MIEDLADRCDILPMWSVAESDWLAAREKGLGGSDLSAVAGVNKYKSALQLWAEKTGTIPAEKLDNEAIRLGNRFERPIAEEFADRFGYSLVEWPVTLRLKSHPWMLANLDFLLVEPDDQFPVGRVTMYHSIEPPRGIIAIVEVKSSGLAGFGTAHQWYGENDEDERMPIAYELQTRHYECVSGIEEAYLVGLLGGRGLQTRHVPWDDDYNEYIFDIERRFWESVSSGVPPEPDGSESAEDALKALYPTGDEELEIEGGATLDLLWHDLEIAKEEFNQAEKTKKELRAKIVAIVGGAAYATVYGKRILSYKNSADSDYFNEKKFAADNPRLYQQYVSKKPGFRTLRGVKG